MAKKRGEGGLVPAGEIPLMRTLAKKFAPPTRAQIELVEVAATITRAAGRSRTGLYGASVGSMYLAAQQPRQRTIVEAQQRKHGAWYSTGRRH